MAEEGEDNMKHPSERVEAALVRLNDELCSWERSTGRQSILILREDEGFVHRTASGKSTIPDDFPDEQLLARFRYYRWPQNVMLQYQELES